jgi:8-oxo-dGTP pyrophosphatase MutT (NUDIX family)
MDKFSKMQYNKPKKEKNIVYDDGYTKLIKYEDWTIMSERDLIVCIPVFLETNEFLIRYEYIPTFKYVDGQDYHITVLSGGVESGEDVNSALLRELEEEAGLVLKDNFKIEELPPLFINKGNINKYYPFIIPLSERDYEEIVPTTDGSVAERKSKSVRVSNKYVNSLKPSDLITDYMLLKLKQYLNITEF